MTDYYFYEESSHSLVLLKYQNATIMSLFNLLSFFLTYLDVTFVFTGCKQLFLGTVASKVIWKLLDNDEKKVIFPKGLKLDWQFLCQWKAKFLPQKFPCNLSWLKTYYLVFQNTGKLVRRVSKISWRGRHVICGWHVMIVKCISFCVLF